MTRAEPIGILRIFPLVTPAIFAMACAASNAAAPLSAPVTTSAPAPAAKAGNSMQGPMQEPMEGAPPKEAQPLPWADFSAATFARAKAEHRFIVMDGSA